MKQTIKLITVFVTLLLFSTSVVLAQSVSFTNANSRLTAASMRTGLAVAVADINGDGLDDIARLQNGHDLYIEYQRPGNTFQEVHIADFGGGSAWGMSVADVDHNGYKDVLAGGSGCKLMKIGPAGQLGATVQVSTTNFFLQNANFMDVNGDGWEDIFCCDDDAPSHIFLNNGSGGFTESTTMINFDITPGQTTGNMNDDSGNYGSVWTDFDNDGDVDLYIAKCRQAYNSPNDNRRWDCLFVNDGNNNYTESAALYNMRDSGQTWTCNFGDIDNDGDLDAIQLDYSSPGVRLKRNDGTGHFTDITAGSGFALTMFQMMQSEMEDFDNDGFIDILVSGETSEYFHNNGNSTFTEVNGQFDANDMHTYAIGDLNHDGKIDVFAGYGSGYTTVSNSVNDVLWLNSTYNVNNYICFNLKGTISNAGGLGARVSIYGPWGIQIRECHAGDAYGNMSTYMLHFGLGTANHVDSVRIKWPSGQITHIVNPDINQYINVTEGGCISPDNAITTSGPTALCSGAGGSVTLSAITGAGYSYLWTNGATTPSITVSTAGEYSCTISGTGSSCISQSPSIVVVVDPVETPTISTTSPLTFCAGSGITLTSTGATGYQWNLNGNPISGQTNQSINITASGTYTITTTGACQNWNSNSITVTALPTPSAPVSSDVTIPTPASTTLVATTGTNDKWYDAMSGGNLLYSGSSYTTPVITTTTTFYVADENEIGGGPGHVGITNQNVPTNLYQNNNTNSHLIFTVNNNCTLNSVKVYTDTYGQRIIELRNSAGTVLQSFPVNIQTDTTIVPVNFALTPGVGYELGTNTAQNVTTLGYNSPRFERNNANVNYPYTLGNAISITTSSQGTGAYYYFYDWDVTAGPDYICASARTPVTVTVTTGISAMNASNVVSVFPNPSTGLVAINLNGTNKNAFVEISDLTGKIILSSELIGNSMQMDISNFAAGAYFISVSNNGNIYKEKLVKQ